MSWVNLGDTIGKILFASYLSTRVNRHCGSADNDSVNGDSANNDSANKDSANNDSANDNSANNDSAKVKPR